jgi:hypothetical protein
MHDVIATTRRAWRPSMGPDEYAALLNELLAAERAGERLLAAYLEALRPDSLEWWIVRGVQLDEARNCEVLTRLLREEGATPTPAVSSLYGRGLALSGWRERLAFVNRAQDWFARRVAAALPRVPWQGRHALQEMVDSHLANIHSCGRLV